MCRKASPPSTTVLILARGEVLAEAASEEDRGDVVALDARDQDRVAIAGVGGTAPARRRRRCRDRRRPPRTDGPADVEHEVLAGNPVCPSDGAGTASSAAHLASRSSWTMSKPLLFSSAVIVARPKGGCPRSCTSGSANAASTACGASGRSSYRRPHDRRQRTVSRVAHGAWRPHARHPGSSGRGGPSAGGACPERVS